MRGGKNQRGGGEEETKVALTAGRTRLLHYTAGRQAPEPPRRSSPPGERRSTPELAFLRGMLLNQTHAGNEQS